MAASAEEQHALLHVDPLAKFLAAQVPPGQELAAWPLMDWVLSLKQWCPTYTHSAHKIGDRLELRCRQKQNKLSSESLHVEAICATDDAPAVAAAATTTTTTTIFIIAVCFPVNRNFDLKSTVIKHCKGGWKKQAQFLKDVADLFNVPCIVNPEISSLLPVPLCRKTRAPTAK